MQTKPSFVGAHDLATVKVAIEVKQKGCDSGKCAEDLAAEALGNPGPKTIEFTSVIRPRTQMGVPRCIDVQTPLGPSNESKCLMI